MNIDISKDLDELCSRAATRFFRIANDSILKRGRFSVALSGGSTPQALYRILADARIKRDKWFFFFGDERNVPPDDPQSNLRMANETLFESIPVEERNVFAWGPGTNEPEIVAEEYAARINGHFQRDKEEVGTEEPVAVPRFDLVLSGMGKDGHTASLFPNTSALKETERIAVANFVPQLNEWRFTMTFPILNSARNIMFLVSGAEKAATLREVIEGEFRPDELPAQSIIPIEGDLFWYIDEAAAEFLSVKRFDFPRR